MGINAEATLNRRFIEMAKLLNIYLNHFPKHEKYAFNGMIDAAATVRKHSLYKFRRAVKAGDTPAVISLLGHARHTNSLQRLLTTAKEIDHALYCALPESHRRIHHLQAQRAA